MAALRNCSGGLLVISGVCIILVLIMNWATYSANLIHVASVSISCDLWRCEAEATVLEKTERKQVSLSEICDQTIDIAQEACSMLTHARGYLIASAVCVCISSLALEKRIRNRYNQSLMSLIGACLCIAGAVLVGMGSKQAQDLFIDSLKPLFAIVNLVGVEESEGISLIMSKYIQYALGAAALFLLLDIGCQQKPTASSNQPHVNVYVRLDETALRNLRATTTTTGNPIVPRRVESQTVN